MFLSLRRCLKKSKQILLVCLAVLLCYSAAMSQAQSNAADLQGSVRDPKGAVVAGALSPADGLKVIATRSKLMSRLSGQGAMALLELGAEEAEKLVGQYPDTTVAVYNLDTTKKPDPDMFKITYPDRPDPR